MGLHSGDGTSRPILRNGFLHLAMLHRTHFAEDVVPGLISDLETTDGMPVGLSPDAFRVEARLDQRSTRIIIEVEIVGGHANNGPVLLVHFVSSGVDGSIVCISHTP